MHWKADVDGNGMLNYEEFMTMSVHLKRMSSDDAQLRQAFCHFDKDGSGYIEFDELKDGLSEDINMGSNGDQFIKDIIYDIDLDKVTLSNIKNAITYDMIWYWLRQGNVIYDIDFVSLLKNAS